MIEIEVYADGLRDKDFVFQLGHQLHTHPAVRYKVDTNHDLVYFEIEDSTAITLKEIQDIFTAIGLHPRFVGHTPDNLGRGKRTQRLVA